MATRTPTSTDDAFRVRLERTASGATAHFEGRLSLAEIAKDFDAFEREALAGSGPLTLDLSRLDSLDGAGATLVVELSRSARIAGRGGEVRGARGSVAALLDLYAPSAAPPPPSFELTESFLAQVGRRSLRRATRAVDAVVFVGAFTREVLAVLRAPRSFPAADAVRILSRTGPDGVAIVALVNFLVGTILGFQSAVQLERYGAEIFVANLVGLSVVRELGPLMTAILVAGRTGAAFAAELGTMKVNEEVDALRTMGLSPQRFLVLPRVGALLVAAPLLAILGDAMGILGGLAIGVGSMEISLQSYWNQTAASIDTSDVVTGLVKSVFFGAIVGLIACHRGLSTRGGAEGVGRATTSAVVTTLFALILADALFTYLFTLFGL